jgi:Kef-type K+ transport system membrane component KefB
LASRRRWVSFPARIGRRRLAVPDWTLTVSGTAGVSVEPHRRDARDGSGSSGESTTRRPNGLNLIGAGDTTVPELGQLGLLYLMFVAGVELDLGLVRVHRRAVILFGLAAFTIPMLFGSAAGFSMHWEAAVALMLGSPMASHTLLVYPTVRNAGLSAHRAVATAVGATVLTDTLSLIVLAVDNAAGAD